MREARLQGKILSFRHDRTPSALVAAPSSAHSSAMPMTRIAAPLLALFLLAAAPIRAEEAGERRPVTILIPIDGLRADYLNRGLTPNISRLAAEGAPGKLRPSFRTTTFHHHYALVTGNRHATNELAGNRMTDTRPHGQ